MFTMQEHVPTFRFEERRLVSRLAIETILFLFKDFENESIIEGRSKSGADRVGSGGLTLSIPPDMKNRYKKQKNELNEIE